VNKVVPDVTSRPFIPEDLPALYAIEEVCFDPPLRFSRSLMRSLAYDPDSRTWVAMMDNIRAGFAMIGLRGENNSTAAYIWTIEILPAFRRLGIANHLLDRLEESAREAGCAAIELHVAALNTSAVDLYERHGFLRTGAQVGFYGRGQDAFSYRKPLLN
jgi:ribosomal-protein-alanine N-acetyltransferase